LLKFFEKILEISSREKIFTVALSGGVFQNNFLTEKIILKLSKADFKQKLFFCRNFLVSYPAGKQKIF